MNRADKAKELFESGCNCCQAVFCAFANESAIPFDTALRICAGLGGGVGRMREVCGAVSGMAMVLSEKFASSDVNDRKAKTELYSMIQKAAEEFKKENGSIVCRELLGLSENSSDPTPEKRTTEYYQKRPCAELVRIAAQIAENQIENAK